jgi:aryl-alcohol dehydrogenase-like predicted oxidoreductase
MIGGDIPVNRMGFGAMRVTGPGVWGEPADPMECLRTLKRLPELGVNFVDTADCYGPQVSEALVRKALHPYENMLIATKGGLCRYEAGQIGVPVGRPEYLRYCVAMSLRNLDVQRLDLWQLHRIDPKVPTDEQFGVIRDLRAEGKIRHVGLSAVSVEEIDAARAFFPVATVQNKFNIVDRDGEDVLAYCERHDIGFLPYFPLGAGRWTATTGSLLSALAKKHNATPPQLALAWLLKRSRVIVPIAGTSKVDHLEENVAATSIVLSDADMGEIDRMMGGERSSPS